MKLRLGTKNHPLSPQLNHFAPPSTRVRVVRFLTLPFIICLVTCVAGTILLSSCSIEESLPIQENESPDDDENSEDTETPAEETEPNYGIGWESIIATSDFAETEINSVGHFIISRNNCWVRGDGVLDATAWKDLVPLINLLARERAFIEESDASSDRLTCTSAGSALRDLKGDVEIKVQRQRSAERKRILLYRSSSSPESGNSLMEICALLSESDRPLLKPALTGLNTSLAKAFGEDCTIVPSVRRPDSPIDATIPAEPSLPER